MEKTIIFVLLAITPLFLGLDCCNSKGTKPIEAEIITFENTIIETGKVIDDYLDEHVRYVEDTYKVGVTLEFGKHQLVRELELNFPELTQILNKSKIKLTLSMDIFSANTPDYQLLFNGRTVDSWERDQYSPDIETIIKDYVIPPNSQQSNKRRLKIR